MRATKAKAEKKTDKRTAAQIKAGVRAVVQSFIDTARATGYSTPRQAGSYSSDSLWDRVFHWRQLESQTRASAVDMALTFLASTLSKKGLI